MMTQRFLPVLRLLVLLACWPFSGLLASSESYVQSITGHLKKGDSLTVIDDKFLNLPLSEWNQLKHLSIEDIVSFELRQDTALVFYTKPFSCTLNVTIKYYTSRDQTSPKQIENIDMVVKYDTAKGRSYPIVAHYRFKDAFKITVVINSINSPEWKDKLPDVFRLKGQIAVERKYPFERGKNGSLHLGAYQPLSATDGWMAGDPKMGDVPMVGGPAVMPPISGIGLQKVNGSLVVSWTTGDFPGAEEYDIEWAYVDGQNSRGLYVAGLAAAGPVIIPRITEDEWMDRDATRVTVTASPYRISLPYQDGYVMVRIRKVSYDSDLRLTDDWVRADDQGNTALVSTSSFSDDLNWQYVGNFSEEGKKKESVTFYDGAGKGRQLVNLSNSDQWKNPGDLLSNPTAIVQETIYDVMGRPTVNMLPAPVRNSSINYYPAFNLNNASQPYSYSDITNIAGSCAIVAGPSATTSGASQYYSPNNGYLSLPQDPANPDYYTRYVPDAKTYPFSATEYTADNTNRIRRQGGVGPDLKIDGQHNSQYFYGKPTSTELERLFGQEVGNSSHYIKNMVVDPNGQASVNYIDANGKTIAAALAGGSSNTIDALPNAAVARVPFNETLIKPTDFTVNSVGLNMSTSSTFLLEVPGPFTVSYSVNPLALVTNYSGGQLCNNCYYTVTVRVTDACGALVPNGSASTTPFTLDEFTCYVNPAPVTQSLTTGTLPIGEYNISYTLQLSQDAINAQTDHYIANNPDLKTLDKFFQDELTNLDLSTCYNTCDACKSLTSVGDFTNKVMSLLQSENFSSLNLQDPNFISFLNTWIPGKFNDLKSHCSTLTCVTSPCEEKLTQLKQDVMPGGQYALYDPNALASGATTGLFPDLATNVLPNYTNSTIGPTPFTADDGTTQTIGSLNQADFLRAYMNHPEWADLFVQYHIEYCSYLWCKDASNTTTSINNEASYIFDANLQQNYQSGTDAATAGYYNHGDVLALLKLDPWFNSGRGIPYYSRMQVDLQSASDVLSMTPTDNGTKLSTKNLIQLVDFLLYCNPNNNNISSAQADASWNSCTPNDNCRSVTMEWTLYLNYYLQLKSKYYRIAKLATSPYQNCLDCFIGTDPLATAGCVVSGTQSDYTIVEQVSGSTFTFNVVFKNGTQPFQGNYTISYDIKDPFSGNTTAPGTVTTTSGATTAQVFSITLPPGQVYGMTGHYEVTGVTCAPTALATCAVANPGGGTSSGSGGTTTPPPPTLTCPPAGAVTLQGVTTGFSDPLSGSTTTDYYLDYPNGANLAPVTVDITIFQNSLDPSTHQPGNGSSSDFGTFTVNPGDHTYIGSGSTAYQLNNTMGDTYDFYDQTLLFLNSTSCTASTPPSCPTVSEFHLEQSSQSPYTLSPDLECRFYTIDLFLVHNGNTPVAQPVTMTIDPVNTITKPNGGGFVSSTDYQRTATIPAGQSQVKVDTYPYAQEAPGANDAGACNTSTWAYSINQAAGTTCGTTTPPPPPPPPTSTCTANPQYAAYQNKIRVFNDYTAVQAYDACNASSLAGSSLQQQQTQNATTVYAALTYNLSTLQGSWLSLLQSVRDEEFVNDPTALATLSNTVLTDITTKMQQLSLAYLNYALQNGLPLVTSSTMPPGLTDPNGYSSYAQIFAADLPASLIQRGFGADLIDNVYPYDKQPIAADVNAVQLSSDIYNNVVNNIAAFQSRYQAAGSPGGSFGAYLKAQLGDDYFLTDQDLADIQTRIANGCTTPYLANPVILPAALTVSPSLSGTSCNTIVSLKSSFLTTYSQVTPDSKLYQILLTNYLNHSLGYPLSYGDYASVLDAGGCTGQLVYDKPETPTVFPDYFACTASLIGQTYTLAGQEYDIYITQIRIAFRNAYVAKCLSNQASANVSGVRQEYQYTLYYYDQANNLVKTIPPEGVRLLTDQQITEVEELPNQDPAACSMFPSNIVYDATTIQNDLASGLQSNMKSMELWLYSADGTSTRQMRLIDQNSKYMYQVAISGGKIWAELYSLLPDGNGGISITLTNGAEGLLPAQLPLLSWTHVVIESGGGLTGGVLQIYVDGNKLTMQPPTNSDPYPFAWEIDAGFTLPAVDYSQIKHIRLYNQSLSDAQVLADFKNSCLMIDQSIPGSELNLWGRFDAPSFCNNTTGRTTAVSVPNKGSLVVTANANPAGTLSNNAFPTVTNNFTMEFWVKPAAGVTDFVRPGYLYSGVDDHPPYAIFPMFGSLDGTLAGTGVSVGQDGITVFEHTMMYLPVAVDLRWSVTDWTHVAVVYQNKIPNIFINGVQRTFNTTPSTKIVFPSFNFGGSTYGVMPGNVDEVRIWNYARTGDQISKAYNRTLAPSEQDGLIGYWPMDNTYGNTFHDMSCGNNSNEPFITPAEGWTSTGAPLTETNYVEFAGRLIVPNHGLPSNYAYNSLNEVVQLTTPDAGTSTFVYDRLGRLVISQNAEQRQPAVADDKNPAGRYSYTHYDDIGRINEVGEKVGGGAVSAALGLDDDGLTNWYNNTGSNRQVTITAYDNVPTWMPSVISNFQTNLRRRVAATALLSSGSNGAQNRVSASYYSYDADGNVSEQYQENAALAADEAQLVTGSNGLKHIQYDYDLISGKVNRVTYQAGKWDQFFYQYKYDDDNRLIGAYSSRTNESLLSGWIKDAGYIYYHHGLLARQELGSSRVQGLDFAYTLQGWMKGINGQHLSTSASTTTDVGGDGSTNSAYSQFSRDVMGYGLGYYNGDYQPIGGSTATAFGNLYTATGGNTTSGQDLFNGNISNATYSIAPFEYIGASGNATGFVGYTYRYDQLNRLTGMDRHSISPSVTGWDNSSIIPNGDYQERVGYDGNGNILSYNRNGRLISGRSNNSMDQLTYNYNRDINGNLTNNKLRHITDGVTLSAPSGDPQDLTTQGTDNYNYDAIGNLMHDDIQQLSRINWTPYGKIASIGKVDGSSLGYGYDPGSNRITKTYKTGGGITNTHYVRDAQGNVLAVYQYKEDLSGVASEGDWLEQHIYGTTRLGIVQPHKTIQSGSRLGSDSYQTGDDAADQAGNRIYELTNHLGNVLVTIDDGLNPANATPNPNLLSAQDYYPFGMQMPGRTYLASGIGNYRYGYNGKENDNEVEGIGNQIDYGMRVYDPRLGRFLSKDPLTSEYPELTPYQYASNRPIEGVDRDGLEFDQLKEYYRTHPLPTNKPQPTTSNQFAGLNLSILHLEKESYDGSSWLGWPFGKSKVYTFGNNTQVSAWNQTVGAVEFASKTFTKEGRKQQDRMMFGVMIKGIMWLCKDRDDQIDDLKDVVTDPGTYEDITASVLIGKIGYMPPPLADVDLMGGPISKLGKGWINFDAQAAKGIADDIKNFAKYFGKNAVGRIVANNPQASFLKFVTKALKSGGTITIRGQMKNPFFKEIWDGVAEGLENYEEVGGSRKAGLSTEGYNRTDGAPLRGKDNINEITFRKK